MLLLLSLITAYGQTPGSLPTPDGEPPKNIVSGNATFATSFVSGPVNAGTTGRTLSGTYAVGRTHNPALRFGLGLGLGIRTHDSGLISASWSIRRDVAFRDTDPEIFAPGTGGTTSQTVFDTSDLTLRFNDSSIVHWEQGELHLTAGASLVVPASRESLVCNPMFAALGATVGARKGFGERGGLGITAGAHRAFFAHAAPPRGACTVALQGTPQIDPTPWAGSVYSGTPNPAWTVSSSLGWAGIHRVFVGLPGTSHPIFERLMTNASVGVLGQIRRQQPAAIIQTLSGTVEVDASKTPAVWVFPWSLSLGYRAHDHVLVNLTLSNQVPQLLYDVSARFRSLPATTAITASVTGNW
jgi:hypothetical protein